MSSSGIYTSSLGLTVDRLFEIINYVDYRDYKIDNTLWDDLIEEVERWKQHNNDHNVRLVYPKGSMDHPKSCLMAYLVKREKQMIHNAGKTPNHVPFDIVKNIQSLYYHILVIIWVETGSNQYIKRIYLQEITLGDRSGHMHQFIQALRNLNMLLYPYNNDRKTFTVNDATKSVQLYSWRAKGINPSKPTGLVMTRTPVSFSSNLKISQEFHTMYREQDMGEECLLVLSIPIQHLIISDRAPERWGLDHPEMTPGCTYKQSIDQIFPAGLMPIHNDEQDEV
jgi:hypothetical protein